MTWSAAQAELERRQNLRSTDGTGKGRYDWRYAFSGIIECAVCGAQYRRHNYTHGKNVEAVWTCKEHLKSRDFCAALPIKEIWLEAVWVKTLNGLLENRDEILKAVVDSISEATAEAGESADTTDAVKAIDAQIEALQARMLDLNKQRTKREIDAEQYNSESKAAMEKLDGLFAERDNASEQQSAGILGKVYRQSVAEFLASERRQDTFDKEVFTRLVAFVKVKDRENITFGLKDGTTVKADISVTV